MKNETIYRICHSNNLVLEVNKEEKSKILKMVSELGLIWTWFNDGLDPEGYSSIYISNKQLDKRPE